jgi:ketosteroid isomerase-like protein
MTPTPTETMRRYFDAWKAREFDDFQALLADDVTFEGPLGTADDAASCRAGIEGMSGITTDIVVHTMAADGENVVTMFDLHTTGTEEPVLVANWAQIGEDRRIKRIRVTFDPRPILSTSVRLTEPDPRSSVGVEFDARRRAGAIGTIS